MKNIVLTTEQSRQADSLTMDSGTPGIDLMAHAGLAVARVIQNEYPGTPVFVLVGPGNNGGDAIVTAIELDQAGFNVELVTMIPLNEMSGDARHFADQWQKETTSLEDFNPREGWVIVDGLFAAGFRGNLPEVVNLCFESIKNYPIVAIDLPSGVDGNTGQVLGNAPECSHTVTFFQLKIGHLIYPGRKLCGTTHVCDIGISDACLDAIKPQFFCNEVPDFSRMKPQGDSNKFTRGCLAIVASGNMCGASQLATRAAQRSGCGLVYVLSPPDAVRHYQQAVASAPVLSCPSPQETINQLQSARVSAIVVGPGLTEIEDDPGLLRQIINLQKPMVIDASAITALAKKPDILQGRTAPLVVTPHAGEFKRLFPSLATDNLLQAVIEAAKTFSCVMVYKGHTTLISEPSGKVTFNINAQPDLATSGSGDVLAGMIGSLLAQGWQANEAAKAACWWHAEAGTGFGLIAEDIVDTIPGIARFQLRKSS